MTTFQRGTVVETSDPFGDPGKSRPSLVASSPAHPFHGEQYLAMALTTRTWYEDAIPLPGEAFVEGGVPERSSIVPWGVSSPSHDEITGTFGRVDATTVDTAVEGLTAYLRADH